MKNKIKFALVLPLFLASCSSKTNSKPIVSPNQSQTNNSTEKPNTDTKPSISNTNSTPQEIDVEEKFTSFLFNIKKGYVFKGTNFYYTDDGYSNYCLDVKVKKEGYEFIRYDSKQNEKADRSSVYISYFYSYDPNAKVPYVSEPLLDISNTIDYTPAPIGDNGAMSIFSTPLPSTISRKLMRRPSGSAKRNTTTKKSSPNWPNSSIPRIREEPSVPFPLSMTRTRIPSLSK